MKQEDTWVSYRANKIILLGVLEELALLNYFRKLGNLHNKTSRSQKSVPHLTHAALFIALEQGSFLCGLGLGAHQATGLASAGSEPF